MKTNGTLGGTGSVGIVGVQGGTVSPGVGPGRLNTKSVVFNSGSSGSSLRVELNGAQPGAGYDQFNVNGTVSLGGCKLIASLGFSGATNGQFIIIANDGAEAVTGTFAGLPEGQLFHINSTPFRISYQGGDGNDVVLSQAGATVAAHVDGVSALPNGHPQVSGTGLPFHLYSVERSTDLETWTLLDTIAANDAGTIHYEDTDGFSLPRAFYRFLAVEDNGPQ